MYINFWYVACQARDIPAGAERPRKVQMLGQQFALWRGSDGEIRCVSNTCTHRGGALGDGRVRANCVECPYHGWTFQGDGSCVRIPSLGAGARIPERTRVDAYPVEEKYGLVWVFLGDLAEEQRPPIISIPEWGDPGSRCITLTGDWKIDYKRSVENTLDPAHNEFTHPTQGFFGVKEDRRVTDVKLQDQEWGTGFMGPMDSPAFPQQDMQQAAGREAGITVTGSGHHGPNCTWTFMHVSEALKMHNYMLHTPVTEKYDRWYLITARNSLLDERHDQSIADRSMCVLEHDQYVLEPMRPTIMPRTNKHEFLISADRAIGRYREYCRAWEDRGWRIDVRQMREDFDRVAYAIPSAARRQPTGWVLPAVPLIPARIAPEARALAG
jgi:phenylpropionate dioxygenase-like ring-hydroxylating dioxygenase large terminal subunit